jgi:hypothetical protein
MESTNFGGEDESVSPTDTLWGGFFLTQPAVIPKLERIPPGGFLTVSKCLGEFVPDDWCIGILMIVEPKEPNVPEHWVLKSVFSTTSKHGARNSSQKDIHSAIPTLFSISTPREYSLSRCSDLTLGL